VLGESVKAAKERDTYLPATLSTDQKGRLVATPTRWQGSSDFIGYSRAEALIMVAAGKRHEAGDVSTVLFL
jgi:molybdopterin biosynthesis enzyme